MPNAHAARSSRSLSKCLLTSTTLLLAGCSALAPAPTPTSTSTPAPTVQTLRIELSTTSDWTELNFLDFSAIQNVRVVDKGAGLTHFSADKRVLGAYQSLEAAKALKAVGITVDLDIAVGSDHTTLPLRLDKGANNDTSVRFYNVVDGNAYLLLHEVKRQGSVPGDSDRNSYEFSFDLRPLLQDIATMPTPSPTPTLAPTPTAVGGGSGRLIFELYKAGFQSAFPNLDGNVRVFASDADGANLSFVTDAMNGSDYRLEDVSPDGRLALISAHPGPSTNGDLYLVQVNGGASDPTKLARGLSSIYAGHHAIFPDVSHAIFVGSGSEGNGIYIVNLDGTGAKKIATHTAEGTVLEAANERQVYWSQVEKRTFKDSYGWAYSSGDFQVFYWANLDGSAQGKLESGGREVVPLWGHRGYSFLADGSHLAWIPAQTEPDCTIHNFNSKWLWDGTVAKYAAEPKLDPYNIFRSARGQVVDAAWMEAYVRRCYLMYIASLTDMDNPVKVVLRPPAYLTPGDFGFGREYDVMWSQNGASVLLFGDGDEMISPGFWHQPVLFIVDTTDPMLQLQELKIGLFADVGNGAIGTVALSPDDHELLMQAGSDQSLPYVFTVDLITGTRQSNFIQRVASGPKPYEQLRPWTIRWLP